MKVLLISINAKFIHTNNAVRLLKANSDFDITIYEYTIKDDITDIVNDIHEFNPDVLGFSCYIWNINIITNLITSINLIKTKLVLGGPEVSYDDSFMNLGVDFIIKGEGELVFNQLLHSIEDKTSYRDIQSLTYLEGETIVSNPITEIKDLTTVVLPYYFEEDIPHIKHKISYIESSRGCPYKCSYCLSSLEKSVRFFELEEVKKAIIYLMNHNSKIIKFLDRTFNANKNTIELLQFIIENTNNITVFQFEITGDILDPKIIEYLNEKAPKGLFRFEIGIQSTNKETNLLVDRFQNNKKLFSNIKMIQDGDVIDLHLDLIAGLPEEDLTSFTNTFNQVFKLGAKELQLGFLKMLRGTKIRNEAAKYKYEFDQTAPYQIIKNNVLSNDDINIIHAVEHMLEIYHNKGYFGDNLRKILQEKDNPFNFFKNIADYYESNNIKTYGYQIEDVYNVLFNFLTEKELFLVKIDYLERSKIKPKLFFDVVTEKPLRKKILETLSNQTHYSVNFLYKNSVIITFDNQYSITIYQDMKNSTFKLKEGIN